MMAMRQSTDSANSTNHDPFQQRKGKALAWRSVNMRVKKDEGKQILQDVWGRASNETTAILGPSGSGKTSLLNILAGRIQTGPKLTVESEIFLDGVVVDPTSMQIRRQIAFVAQDDALHISSTPREAILFSAKLRLPKTTTAEELTSLTSSMLSELGLGECADTIIGGALLKGISGGERKRTSVALELVTKPTLVFLDEPTSGKKGYCRIQDCTVSPERNDWITHSRGMRMLSYFFCRSRQL
jgi:ABC-type multidrug transport system ATPase subunit